MPDFVHMHHGDVDACAEAPREAYDALWAELGWNEVEPHDIPEDAAEEAADSPTDPEG